MSRQNFESSYCDHRGQLLAMCRHMSSEHERRLHLPQQLALAGLTWALRPGTPQYPLITITFSDDTMVAARVSPSPQHVLVELSHLPPAAALLVAQARERNAILIRNPSTDFTSETTGAEPLIHGTTMVDVCLWDFAIATATAIKSPGTKPILDPKSLHELSTLFNSWPETRYLLLPNYLPASLKDPTDKESYREHLWRAATTTSLHRNPRNPEEVNRTIAVLEQILDNDQDPERVRSAFLRQYERKVTDYRAQHLRRQHQRQPQQQALALLPAQQREPRPTEREIPEAVQEQELDRQEEEENLETDNSTDTELDLEIYGPDRLNQEGHPHQPPIIHFPREHFPVLYPAPQETYRQCRDRARARIPWLRVELDDLDRDTLRSQDYRHQIRMLKQALRNSRHLVRQEKLRVGTT